MKKLPLALISLSVALSLAACANIERSRSLSDPAVPAVTTAQQVCSTCHGAGGTSISPNFPKLAAQQKEYFVAQLTQFRSHNRSDPAGFQYMWGLSRNLTDAQIEGLAIYYSKQPVKPVAPPKVPSSEGQAIFEKGIPEKDVTPCSTCHGDHGQGNATFPRIANQHADYIVKQLNVFQRTDQRPEGAIMKTIAHGLTPAHMLAVANYLESMPVK